MCEKEHLYSGKGCERRNNNSRNMMWPDGKREKEGGRGAIMGLAWMLSQGVGKSIENDP